MTGKIQDTQLSGRSLDGGAVRYVVTEIRKMWRMTTRRSGALIALFAFVGLALSVFISLAKFRSTYQCDESLLSACSTGTYFSCDQVLASAWATVGWSATDAYPITLFAASFYAVILSLSTQLFRRRPEGIPKSLLLYLAWAGVLVCLPLAYYAYVVVGGICLYCTSLYLVNLALLLSVLLLDNAGQRHQFRVLWRSKIDRTTTLLLAGLFFLVASMLQMLYYRQKTLDVGAEPRCITPIGALPSTPIVFPQETQGQQDMVFAEFALFVDLSCEHCAAAFKTWYTVAKNSAGRYRLSVYPVAADHSCDIGLSFGSESAKIHNPCRAARAVECLDMLAPGRGLDYVQALFEHRKPFETKMAFTTAHLLRIAADIGAPAALPEGALEQCIGDTSDDNPAHNRVLERSGFADTMRITGLPATFLIFFDENQALPLGLRLQGHKNYPDIHRFVNKTHQQILEALAADEPSKGGQAS